jgi:radical SAM superfamily enzyme YgiQ (UPF0313 family)
LFRPAAGVERGGIAAMRALKLLLVNVGKRSIGGYTSTPPLGILTLAAYVRGKLPVEVRLIDQRAEDLSPDGLAARAAAFNPDVIGLSSISMFAGLLARDAACLKAALPRALIIAGGPHVSAFGRRALEATVADAAVKGEGELILEQVLSSFGGANGLACIPALIWRDGAGDVRENEGETQLIEDLDSLPFPAYDLLDYARYWHLPRMAPVPLKPYAAMFSGRGCPYQCTYCHRNFGKRLRLQSAGRIVDEIQHYVKSMGVEEVEFVDDIFNFDSARVVEFARLIRERGVKVRISFPNAVRTDILTDETIDALAEAGTYHCSFALESGSPRIQKLIKKHLNIDRYVTNVAKAVKRGIFAHGYAMCGFPTETEEDLTATLNTMCASRLHTAAFFTLLPFPNTELYAWAERTHPDRIANIRYDMADYPDARTNLSDVPDSTLFAFQRRAWRTFYLNPRRAWRILRDYPEPVFLASFLPLYLRRMTKGLTN